MTATSDEPMRVVFLTAEYPPLPYGGVGVFVRSLARALVARGHEAIVIGATQHVRHRTVDDDEGVVVVRLPDMRARGLTALAGARSVNREMRKWLEHPRVVIEGAELAFWAAPHSWAGKTVVRLHGGHRFFAEAEQRRPKRLRAAAERRSVQRAHQIVAVSQYVADRTEALVGFRGAKPRVIYNGVDEAVFRPIEGLQPEGDTVVFAGALCEKKGLRPLVRAIDDLRREGRPVTLRVAGRDLGAPGGGTFLDDVLAGVSAETRRRVEYVGPIAHADMPAFFGGGTIVALPSLMEAHPIAWIEAMACGRPLVASTAGPGPEVIEDGRNGLLRSPTDAHDIAEGLATLLDDLERAEQLGASAREEVLRRFTLRSAVGANEILYQEVATYA